MPRKNEPLPQTETTESGVTVRKVPTFESSDLVVVRFRLTTSEDGPRIVRLVDELPPGYDARDLGFDPEEVGPEWRHENGQVWFTTVVDGTPVETRYGVRNLDRGAAAAFEKQPRIDAVVSIEGHERSFPPVLEQ